MDNAKIWTIDEQNYSDLPDFVDELHNHGQKYVIIVVGIYLFIYLFIYLSIFLYIYLSIYLFILHKDPAVALNYPVYEDGLQKNVYVRDVNGDVLEGKVRFF